MLEPTRCLSTLRPSGTRSSSMTSPAISVRRCVWWPLMPDKPRKAGNVTSTEKAGDRPFFLWNGRKKPTAAEPGEILFTSMDHDGVKEGICQRSTGRTGRPADHSGHRFPEELARKEDFRDIYVGKANAALAASVFTSVKFQFPN